MSLLHSVLQLFFFNDTATTEIYTLSLHDALPIFTPRPTRRLAFTERSIQRSGYGLTLITSSRKRMAERTIDRKSTRLNSSHANISYAVFCLKKKKNRGHTS